MATVVLTDPLVDLADAARREDGFLDRLLWSFPDPVPPRWTDAGVDPTPREAVEALFERLYELQPLQRLEGEPEPRVVRFDEAARALWRAWFDEHTREAQDEAFPPYLRGAWAKMPAQLARLTLILHACADSTEDTVREETVAAAADLVDYFRAHARRAYQRIRRERRSLALRVLQALRASGPLKQSQLQHDVFRRNVSATELLDALTELEACGLVSQHQVTGTGGRSATVWQVA